MPKIYIPKQQKEFEYRGHKDLLQILLENEVFVDSPCNGKGTCGKCKVRVLNGELPGVSETEEGFLTLDEQKAGVRLACLVVPQGDLTLELLQEEGKHEVLSSGYLPAFDYQPAVTKRVIDIEKPSLDHQISYEKAVENALGYDLNGESVDWRVFKDNKKIEKQMTAVFYQGRLTALESGDTTEQMYGVAIDIGTTTVVTALVDLRSGEELATAAMINPQKKFGLDVLTRITYQMEEEAAAKNLQVTIVEGINQLMEELGEKAGISQEYIYEIVVSANCTMLHFLLGIEATSIGVSPYAPIFVKAQTLRARELGLSGAPEAGVYLLPSVSSYIGADIVAGTYVSELHRSNENLLFIDIGTNGEIVLSQRGKLVSCSCAAGPALEGMNISAGMRAAEGAVEEVRITEQGNELQVIGDREALGICGSGILSVLKELIRIGLVKKNGAFIKMEKLEPRDYRRDLLRLQGTKRAFVLKEGPKELLITQGDVRQVQLAKGAILSGFHALLNKVGIHMEELDQVLIAGQFGAHLTVDNLVGTGILPEEVREKIRYVGNASKTGAYMALMSTKVRKEMEDLANTMDYMELGATENYERLFAKALQF